MDDFFFSIVHAFYFLAENGDVLLHTAAVSQSVHDVMRKCCTERSSCEDFVKAIHAVNVHRLLLNDVIDYSL